MAEQELEGLLAEAEDCLENVEDCLGGVDDVATLDEETLESVLGDVETLARVATALEELLETIDFATFPEAIDGEDALDALEVGDLPDALDDEETGVTDAVDLTQLVRAVDLLEAWDATALGSIWEQSRKLEGAVDDLADTGEETELVGEDGLVGGEDGLLEDVDLTDALGDIDVMDDPEAYQVAIQQQAMRGIDAFREAILETHVKFDRLYEFNREKMRRQDTSANSRNPTAASTMPTEQAALGSVVNHSTVPQEVRLSTAPSRKRIYGPRFERERQKRRSDND